MHFDYFLLQEQLGDIVFVDIPEVGKAFAQNETFGALSLIISPCSTLYPLALAFIRFLRALAFIFSGYFRLPLHLDLFFLHLHLAAPCFFLLVTCCRVQHGPCSGVVLRRSAWSRGALFGTAALCLVPRRSVWYIGALLRGLSQCRCECALVDPCESLASRVPVVPLPLHSKYRGTTVSSAIDPAPRGEDGMVAFAEEAESSASSAGSDRPFPSSALPEDSSHGSRERKNPFKVFLYLVYIYISSTLSSLC